MNKKEIIDRFKVIASATVSDACKTLYGCRRYMDHEIVGRISDQKLVGYAVTVQEGPVNGEAPGRNHAMEAMDACEEDGCVMVISLANSDKNVSLWGGIMTAAAVANYFVGAVLDAGVRDIEEIRAGQAEGGLYSGQTFQVFSRSVSPNGIHGQYKTLASNVPVMCGGIEVCPGDLIVGDCSGVVAIPKDCIEAVLEFCEQTEKNELLQARLILEKGSVQAGLEAFRAAKTN